jgi:hypothetical protein
VKSKFDFLGKSWLREHRGVLDYADNRLWQKVVGGSLRPLTFDLPGIASPAFATTRHPSAAFSTHGYLQAVLDFTKELPEDAELDLGDLPGIAPSDRSSFSFVEDDVRLDLAYLPMVQVDAIVQLLRAFEGDVFETRTQPRPPPPRSCAGFFARESTDGQGFKVQVHEA